MENNNEQSMVNDRKSSIAPEAVWEQLRRILSSNDFNASERNRRFLKYVVEETLDGRADRIKAYNIATSVFDRDGSFDPQVDSIVRIEAGRLRRSLERFYLTAGTADAIRIVIPRGRYVPEFECLSPAASACDVLPQSEPAQTVRPGRNGRAILVLPFEEDGDQSALPNFTRGLMRQIIVGLTRFTDLIVFERETCCPYGGKTDLASVGDNLGVAYLLRGGTSMSATHFSVDALLIDVRSGQHLWAESFERKLDMSQVFRVRDEVANCVARTLAQPYGVIFSNIAKDTDLTLPKNMCSFDYVVQFYQYWRSHDPSLFEPVRVGLEDVVVHDPHYAEAFACLSQMYSNAVRFHHNVRGATNNPLQRALALAHRAVELAPSSSRGHHALSLALWFAGDVRGALMTLETSSALNPNDTDVMGELGLRYAVLARWDEAAPLLEEAFARNPSGPSIYRIGLFLYHYANGRHEAALAEARKIDAPHLPCSNIAVAMAAAQLGLKAEAADAVQAILRIDPRYGDHVVADMTARNLAPELIRLVVAGLRKAGLPGGDTDLEGRPPALRATALRECIDDVHVG